MAARSLAIVTFAAATLTTLLAFAQDGGVTAITSDGFFKQRPQWSLDGKHIVFARHRGPTIFLFVRSLETGEERRLTEHDGPEFDAMFSPDGRQLVFTYDKVSPNQGDIDVYRIDFDGTHLTPIATSEGKLTHEESPCWSPDGAKIAFTSTYHGNQELYIADADGKNVKRLTTYPGTDSHPAWSPEGKSIAIATDRWGDLEIATIDVESGQVHRVTESKGFDDYPCWSPDGPQLLFTSNRDGNLEIYRCNRDGSQPVNLTRDEGWDNFATWNRDGSIGFVSNRDGGFEIYVMRR